jgi:hypothetical protein
VGSLAGAYAGAYAAQKIALRAKVRDEVVREVRNLNAAISLAAGVASSAFNLKAQHIVDIHATYVAERERFAVWTKKRSTGEVQGDGRFELKLDLRTAPTLNTPIDVLSPLVYGSVSATGRPLNLCAALAGAIQNLNVAIAQRSQLIETIKAGQLPAGADLVSLYLGLPYGGGHVNQEFGDYLAGIASYVDDVIFFSTQLCADLTKYGEELITRHKKNFKLGTLSVSRTDFSEQQAAHLLPDESRYQTWFTGFQKREP